MKRTTGALIALVCGSSLAIAQGAPDRGGDRGGGVGGGDGGGFSRGAGEVRGIGGAANARSGAVQSAAQSAAHRSRAPSGRFQAVLSAPSPRRTRVERRERQAGRAGVSSKVEKPAPG